MLSIVGSGSLFSFQKGWNEVPGSVVQSRFYGFHLPLDTIPNATLPTFSREK